MTKKTVHKKTNYATSGKYDVEELERKISESSLTLEKISEDTGKSIEWLEDYFYNGLTIVNREFYEMVNKIYGLNLPLWQTNPHVHKKEN